MRKIVVSEFVSLDGVMEDPAWTVPFTSDEQVQFKFEELLESDALLLGRVTYEGFAASWPHVTDRAGVIPLPDGFADRMNNYPKYVVTSTLQQAEWNNSSIVRGNIAEEVAKLKRQPGRNILVLGSCELVEALMRYDLVDEYRIAVFPVIVGRGKRLFQENGDTKTLKHVSTRTLRSGVTVLTYHPAKQD